MSFMGSSGAGKVALRVFARAAAALTGGGRYHEADVVVDRCLALAFGHRFPFDPREAARRPQLAIERWEAVLRAAPDLPIAHYRLSSVLRNAGDLDRGAEVIAGALHRFPNDLGTTIEAALLAERRDDHPGACQYWQTVLAATAPRPPWIARAAHALMLAGRVDHAGVLLAKARSDHPRHAGLMAAECMLASRKGEWAKATALASEFHRRFPKYKGGREVLGHAIYAEALGETDARAADIQVADAPVARPTIGRVKDEEIRRLLLRFESIGDSCEFGMVQRRFGAEPLGLFRWNLVEPEALIDALDRRLEGLGDPEHTELFPIENGEFFVQDRRWFFGMHTFLYADQTTHEELYPVLLHRIARLKALFVADLGAAEKIFVYRSPGLDGETLAALHRALRGFGPVRLLAVQPAHAAAPAEFGGRPGEVTVVAPGCFVGFISRLGVAADGTWNIAYDEWVSVCRNAEVAASREMGAAP